MTARRLSWLTAATLFTGTGLTVLFAAYGWPWWVVALVGCCFAPTIIWLGCRLHTADRRERQERAIRYENAAMALLDDPHFSEWEKEMAS